MPGALLCPHVAHGHKATKYQVAGMNGRRDVRNKDLNPSLSDCKPRAFNHWTFHFHTDQAFSKDEGYVSYLILYAQDCK